MKTSNTIFLSFLIFIFGGITLIFITTKYGKGYYDDSNYKIHEKLLPSFSVIVAEPNASFTLKDGKVNTITMKYRKDTVPHLAPFTVRNDTLFISSDKKAKLNEMRRMIIPTVFCKNIKQIIAKEKANLFLDKFKTDTLGITMNKSQLNWSDIEQVGYVWISAKSANVNLSGENLKKIDLELDETSLYIKNKIGIKSASGNLKNNSSASFFMDGKVNLDIDKSSTSSIYFQRVYSN